MPDVEAGGELPLSPESLPEGTNVLIAGEPLTRKRAVMLELLETPDRAAILATTKLSAARMQESFDRRHDAAAWDLRFVDCASRSRSVNPVRETGTVKYASDPGDLTGIGIDLSGFMQEFYHRDDADHVRLGFGSLSPVLMYADLRRVYQFLHVITGRVASSGFAGVFTLDTVGGDDQITRQLTQVFDALVEVRSTAEGQELRVRGGGFGPETWTEF
ncbi:MULTISPECIES: recombinase RecA [Halorussus]|uniref:DUF7504 family protein n=1 Tax=Halorussus TaxID=1070314 RepID=UPI0013B3BBD7|nr:MULTISPECIES: recombinase RecA [Halorussus]NHN60642.1 recombinase RecA [Halorussus sp. JP-T4]